MTSLFTTTKASKPLADEIRRTTIDEIYGQEHLFVDNVNCNQLLTHLEQKL